MKVFSTPKVNKPGWYLIDYSNKTGKSIKLHHHDGKSPLMDKYKSVLYYSENLKSCLLKLDELIRKSKDSSELTLSYQDKDWKYEG